MDDHHRRHPLITGQRSGPDGSTRLRQPVAVRGLRLERSLLRSSRPAEGFRPCRSPVTSFSVMPGPGSAGWRLVGPPRYPTRFVGRRAEVAALRGLLQPGRLVTVVGLGGAGKTRLAAEMVGGQTCMWVDLSVATGPVTCHVPSPRPWACPQAVVLIRPSASSTHSETSRRCWSSTTARSARRLPRPRRCAAGRGASLDCPGNESAAARLCLRVAVSLAAVSGRQRAVRRPRRPSGKRAPRACCRHRHRTVSPGRRPAAGDRVVRGLVTRQVTGRATGEPTGGAVTSRTLTVLPRHRDMTAVLDASMALLTSAQQRVLLALGVFAGGFTAEAAAAVAAPISARSPSWSSAA